MGLLELFHTHCRPLRYQCLKFLCRVLRRQPQPRRQLSHVSSPRRSVIEVRSHREIVRTLEVDMLCCSWARTSGSRYCEQHSSENLGTLLAIFPTDLTVAPFLAYRLGSKWFPLYPPSFLQKTSLTVCDPSPTDG